MWVVPTMRTLMQRKKEQSWGGGQRNIHICGAQGTWTSPHLSDTLEKLIAPQAVLIKPHSLILQFLLSAFNKAATDTFSLTWVEDSPCQEVCLPSFIHGVLTQHTDMFKPQRHPPTSPYFSVSSRPHRHVLIPVTFGAFFLSTPQFIANLINGNLGERRLSLLLQQNLI